LVLTTTIGAALSGEDAVNARKRQKRKPSAKSGKKHSRKKHKNGKGGKGNKGKKSASGSSGCAVHHTEQQILDFISQAAKKYGQPENAMVRVARCESNLNPCAVNRSGPYYGLYQYL
jgi:hypothetical protein